MVAENVSDLQMAWLAGMSYLVASPATPVDATVLPLQFRYCARGNPRLQCPIAMTLMEGIDLDAGSYGSASGVLRGGGPGN